MNLEQRPDTFDWEVLADEDAEYREWVEARQLEDLVAIDADPANDVSPHAA
jgi:hypothetical protein